MFFTAYVWDYSNLKLEDKQDKKKTSQKCNNSEIKIPANPRLA